MKTSAHIEPVKPASERHNRREKKLDYVIAERTHLNDWWSCDSQSNRLASLKKLVKVKTGRTMQKSATPIKEGVIVIKPGTTMDDLQNLSKALKQRFGIECFQIAIHRDEGKGDKINYHAHMVFDWIDHETGKSFRLNRQQMSELQDIVADVLEMDRGESSSIKHLNAIQYKAQIEQENAQKELQVLEARKNTLETDNALIWAENVIIGQKNNALSVPDSFKALFPVIAEIMENWNEIYSDFKALCVPDSNIKEAVAHGNTVVDCITINGRQYKKNLSITIAKPPYYQKRHAFFNKLRLKDFIKSLIRKKSYGRSI